MEGIQADPKLLAQARTNIREDQWSPEEFSRRLARNGTGMVSHEPLDPLWTTRKPGIVGSGAAILYAIQDRKAMIVTMHHKVTTSTHRHR